MRAVSHLPVLVPRWASLPNDKRAYDQPAPLTSAPGVLKCEESASCACIDGKRAYYDPLQTTTVRECTVYTLMEPYRTTIELQVCPRCPPESRRYIGPDLRTRGIFNYNNSALFSHQLLNEYISAFTSSETPIEPWVQQTARRYEDVKAGNAFVGGGLFRAAWFAYVRLMSLENDKCCPRCGDHPESVIWDGVSIAFGRKHVNTGLQPPTISSPDAPRRSSKSAPGQQWLHDGKRRKELRDWLRNGGLKIAVPARAEEEGGPRAKEEEKELKAAIQRVQAFPELEKWLSEQDVHLGNIFKKRLGWDAVGEDKKWRPQREYRTLFEIVSVKKR